MRVSLLLFVVMVLVSCTGYHYITPLTPTHQFEKQGDMEARGSIGPYLLGFQASVSPVKHLGLSYALGLDAEGSVTNAYVLHGYAPVLAEKGTTQLVFHGSLGYNKGTRKHRIDDPLTYLLTGISETWYTSNYESYSAGAGIHFLHRASGFRAGVDVHFHEIRFFSLQTEIRYSDPNKAPRIYSIQQPQLYRMLSPVVNLSYEPFAEWLMFSPFLSTSIGVNRPYGPRFMLYRNDPGPGSNANEVDGPDIPGLFFSYSLGFRWNLNNGLKKKS